LSIIANPVEKFAYIILALGTVGGLAGMLSILKPPRAGRYESVDLERYARSRKTFARGFHTFSTFLAGLALLLVKATSAFEILVGVILVRGLIEVGLINWKPKIAPGRTGSLKDTKRSNDGKDIR
jgi:hypothetical protein